MENSDGEEKKITPPEAALREIFSGDLPNTYLARVAYYEEKGDFESAILLYEVALHHLPSDGRLIAGMYGALLSLLNEKKTKFYKDKETARDIRHLEQTLMDFEGLNNIPLNLQ